MRESTRLSTQEIESFVEEHFRRNPNCDYEHITSGWRVKFGRPMDSREAAAVREIFELQETLREERMEAERAAAEARKPKGPINKFLAMRWQGQMLFGLVVFLVALYGPAMVFYTPTQQDLTARMGAPPASVSIFDNPGFERASSFLFWVVLVTGGVGGIVILFISWGIGYAVIRALRALLHRPAGI